MAVRAYERFLCGDLAAAGERADEAIALGERHHNAEAAIMGETCRARVTLLRGRLDEGLALLEEVGARLMAGEADALVTGMMLCEVICAAQNLALHDVAQEWTDVMERWRHGAAVGSLHGRCRVHRAELLRISGPCADAEAEALAACAELRPWMRREYGWPLVELGTIRLRRGDLAGAEEAFCEAQAHAWDPQPGLALLHLARGEVDRAAAQVAAAIAHPPALPSKEQPPVGELRIAPLLAAQAEIAVADDDPTTAAAAAERLARIAEQYPSRPLAAAARLARARAGLLVGQLDASAQAATAAVREYAEMGAPYESARARQVLAEVHARAGRATAAHAEADTARAALVAFGVKLPADPPPPEPPGVTADDAAFVCQGKLRLLRFAGTGCTVPDLTGLRYVERLLARPGSELHVLDLVGATGLPTAGGGHDGLPVLDGEARRAYRRRLRDIEEDLDEARSLHDQARIELAERDREYLLAELRRAVGLHGRSRTSGSTAERARTRVARSIRYALDRLAEQHPLAAAHLRQAIRTGTYCSYQPDPAFPVRWKTGSPS
jgi:tetratricopeptide (TPR) repeat protein